MKRNQKPCPRCGGGIMKADSHWDDIGKKSTLTWRCRNCDYYIARRSWKTRKVKEREARVKELMATVLQ